MVGELSTEEGAVDGMPEERHESAWKFGMADPLARTA